MTLVQIASHGWGWIADTEGNGQPGITVTLNGTVYTDSTGVTPLTPVVTDVRGVIPGWIESGTYTLDVPGEDSLQVEAVSGAVESNIAGRVINAKSEGVKADGVTDDSAAWNALIAAVPEGASIFWRGNSLIASSVTVNRRVNLVGAGVESAFTVNVGAAADGLIFDHATSPRLEGLTSGNFAVLGGASAARYAVVLRDLARCDMLPIFVKAGAEYAVSVEGCLINWLRFLVPGNNITFPYAATSPTNGIRIVGSAAHPSNANFIDAIVEALAGLGLLMDTTVGMSGAFNNWIEGTYEGLTGLGIHIKSNGATFGWTVGKAHLESATPASQNQLRVEGSSHGTIGPGVRADLIEIVNSRNTGIDGVECYGLSIDSASHWTRLGRVRYGAGGVADSGVHTTSEGHLHNLASVDTAQAGSGPTETDNKLRSDGLRAWDTTPKPVGSSIVAGTITKTGDGQVDTRRLFVPFAGKMAGGAAIYHEAVSAADLEEIKGQVVTLSAWVYIPSAQTNQPTVIIETNIGGGATHQGQQTAATDVWTRLSITTFIPTSATGLNLRLRNTNALTGDWYIAGTACVIGRVAPRTRAPRVPSRRYAELTWDPASIADGAVANQNVTVQGTALGDQAVASFSLGTGNGVMITARVVAASTVQVTVFNKSGGALDLASGALRVETWSY